MSSYPSPTAQYGTLFTMNDIGLIGGWDGAVFDPQKAAPASLSAIAKISHV